MDYDHELQVLDIAIRMAKDTASIHKDDFIGKWAIGRLVDLECQKIRITKLKLTK